MYQELIKRLIWTASNDDKPFDAETATLAAEAIKKLHEQEKRNNWISVEDRMPEDDADLTDNYKKVKIKVLVAIKAKNGITIRTQTRFRDFTYQNMVEKTYWLWRYSVGTVTHWMPLPEPPKEGKP